MSKLQKLMDDVSNWGNKQFDNGLFNPERSIPTSYHLQEEATELTSALENFFNKPNEDNFNAVRFELADNLILLVQIAKLVEISSKQLIRDSNEKLEINKNRDWGEPDKNGVVKHI